MTSIVFSVVVSVFANPCFQIFSFSNNRNAIFIVNQSVLENVDMVAKPIYIMLRLHFSFYYCSVVPVRYASMTNIPSCL